MSLTMKVLIAVALLCPSALADDCAGDSPEGSCVLGQKEREETSFVQIQQVLKPGNDRITVDDTPHGDPDRRRAKPVSKELVPLEPHFDQRGNLAAFFEANSTATLKELLINEIEFEVGKKPYEVPEANKIIIVLLEVLICPGFCGIDRCCMGQTCLGVLKGFTLGGLFVWWIIDLVVILVNALSSSTSIHSLGFVANWSKGSVNPAFIIAVVWLIFACCGSCISTGMHRCCGGGEKKEELSLAGARN